MSRTFETLTDFPPDASIAQSATLAPIGEIAAKLGLEDHEWEPYGRDKAKVELSALESRADRPDGKLVLVTAMTATRYGDGKTVTSIGLSQGLGHLGQRQTLCLREPSLGPTFGIKGGAAGGGYAQVVPMDDINMHFTGDLHAIAAAHNLLAALVDNQAHFELRRESGELPTDIDPKRILWRRVIDLCDRQLRNCEIGRGKASDGFVHETGFDITASSEIMAIAALSQHRNDLRERLASIVVGYRKNGEPLRAGDLDCVGALEVLLKDAIRPNLVQTLEKTPALVHCGPFANIAHGCNSVLATKMGMKFGDYTVTEAGFAADLGAEKFLDIKCRQLGTMPAAVVLVVTCRALKLHGGIALDRLKEPDLEALHAGFANVRTHCENLAKYGLPVVVALNRFGFDSNEELNAVMGLCKDIGVPCALSQVAHKGGPGGVELAEAVMAAAEGGNKPLAPLYSLEQSLEQKVETLAKEIYRADGVDFSEQAKARLKEIEALGGGKLPVCVAKTQHSISDNPELKGAPKGFRLQVRDLKLSAGAGFVVVQTGNLLLMPGMPSTPSVGKIGIDADGKIFGLS